MPRDLEEKFEEIKDPRVLCCSCFESALHSLANPMLVSLAAWLTRTSLPSIIYAQDRERAALAKQAREILVATD